MDQLMTSEVQESQHEQEMIKTKMLDLLDIYYEALDAAKTGNKVIFSPIFYMHQVLTSGILFFFTVCCH
jgi:RNA-dependent RNA polymerase